MNNPYSSMAYTALAQFLQSCMIPYRENYILKYNTYFKSGGEAAFYVTPQCARDLIFLVKYLKENNIPWKLVGFSSNLFFLDELSYGVIISTSNMTKISLKENLISVECGYPLQDMVRVALINGLGGMEGLEGIPGSIGGALFMNAGAYGYTISDHLVSVTAISPEGEIVKLSKEECGFQNRSSIFKRQPEYVIVSADFALPNVDRASSAKAIEVFHIARHSYQEFVYPNLGSMFSVRGDFYKELFSSSKMYSALCFCLKLVLRNPVAKFFNRRRPTNKPFHLLAGCFLSRLYSLNYQVSKKSMNILINDGFSDLNDKLEYIYLIRKYLNPETPIENEIVLSPADWSTAEAKMVLDKLRSFGLLNEADGNCVQF